MRNACSSATRANTRSRARRARRPWPIAKDADCVSCHMRVTGVSTSPKCASTTTASSASRRRLDAGDAAHQALRATDASLDCCPSASAERIASATQCLWMMAYLDIGGAIRRGRWRRAEPGQTATVGEHSPPAREPARRAPRFSRVPEGDLRRAARDRSRTADQPVISGALLIGRDRDREAVEVLDPRIGAQPKRRCTAQSWRRVLEERPSPGRCAGLGGVEYRVQRRRPVARLLSQVTTIRRCRSRAAVD